MNCKVDSNIEKFEGNTSFVKQKEQYDSETHELSWALGDCSTHVIVKKSTPTVSGRVHQLINIIIHQLINCSKMQRLSEHGNLSKRS
jgi:hypothetical protein